MDYHDVFLSRATRGCLTALGLTVALNAAGAALQWRTLTAAQDKLAGGITSKSVPTQLVSGDFDEDGVVDLAVAYRGATGDAIKIYRGNLEAIHPSARAAQSTPVAPFLNSTRSLALSESANRLASGDFNADGHLDLISARVGGDILTLHLGDGRGGFAAGEQVALGGSLTAMTAGEVNRPDGLTDLVVGVSRADQYELHIFEGPDGALRHVPEVITLPAMATDLVLGEVDGASGLDLAVAAGRQLILLHGRDRQLSFTSRQEDIGPTTNTKMFAAEVKALAVGEFERGRPGQRELAALTADGQLSLLSATGISDPGSRPLADWQVLDVQTVTQRPKSAQLTIANLSGRTELLITGGDRLTQRVAIGTAANESSRLVAKRQLNQAPSLLAVHPMRLNADALTDLVVLAQGANVPRVLTPKGGVSIVVDSTGDDEVTDGACTLREAIGNANDNAATFPDCTSGASFDTISFNIAGGGSTQTISIATELPAITDSSLLDGTTQCATPPCVQLDGSTIVLNGATELNALALNGGASMIRGMVISNFPLDGIQVFGDGGHIVDGNYVGLDLTGSIDQGVGRTGIEVLSPGNLVGGRTAAARNVVSGNAGGISVFNFGAFSDASQNRVEGNYVGSDASGLVAIGNDGAGIFVGDANDNTVGGTAPGAGNLSVDNQWGVVINQLFDPVSFQTQNNLVQGNTIGLNANGKLSGNRDDGVIVFNANNNTIGGTTPAARNILSGNSRGVFLWPTAGIDTTNNLIQGNYIGTDATGTQDLGNGGGILLQNATDNVVGGTALNAGNLISGNVGGVQLQSNGDAPSARNTVQGNLIGTDASGTLDLGNEFQGIFMSMTTDNTIGGPDPAARNVISGNGFGAIQLETASVNVIQNNYLGTSAAGDSAIPNENGIAITNSSDNTIGGAAAGNLISGNRNGGILIISGINNRISQNDIFDNAIQGIEVGAAGPEPNDPGDADSGPNNLQNHPVIDSVIPGSTIITGTLNTTPDTTITVEFFVNADCLMREGAYLASIQATTDSNGDADIGTTLASDLTPGQGISATATDPNGNTSEYSDCAALVTELIFADGFEDAP